MSKPDRGLMARQRDKLMHNAYVPVRADRPTNSLALTAEFDAQWIALREKLERQYGPIVCISQMNYSHVVGIGLQHDEHTRVVGFVRAQDYDEFVELSRALGLPYDMLQSVAPFAANGSSLQGGKAISPVR